MKPKNEVKFRENENLSTQGFRRINSAENATEEDQRRLMGLKSLTNPSEIVPILEQGVTEWNAYREEIIDQYLPDWKRWLKNGFVTDPDIIFDFSGANFEGKDLDESNLEHAILKDVIFRNANLENTNLSGATFDGTNLESADLTGANISGIYLKYWLINDETKFTDCICESIFIRDKKINIPLRLTTWLLEKIKERTKELGS